MKANLIFKNPHAMKAIYSFAVMILLAGIFTGCQKATKYHPALYFTGTEQFPEKKISIEGPVDVDVSITSSIVVSKDISVKIKIQPELLDAYNDLKGTAYKFLPDGSFSISATDLVIRNGVNISDVAKFSITTLANFLEGVTYCVPITIIETNGDIPVLESSRTLYLIIKQTIITRAASLVSSRYFKVPSFLTTPAISSVSALTLECRVYVNAFQTANPFITSIMGIEETFLLRFGDVSIPNNKLQLAGGQINGGGKFPVTSQATFATGKWYHVAAVYNGSTISVFVDGVLDNYTDAQSGGIDLTNSWSDGFLIGRSAGGRYLNGYVSEARVWTKALTATELQNNLCYVDPASPGLLAYWRFNGDINGLEVADLTGHGHTAVANNSITWVNGVRCP